MLLNLFLESIRQDAFDHVDWGTLTAPTLVDPSVDLIGQGSFPACDVVVENFEVSDERFNHGIVTVRYDAIIFIATLSDVEKYVEKIVKSYSLTPSFASIVEEMSFDVGQEQDLKMAIVRIKLKSELGY